MDRMERDQQRDTTRAEYDRALTTFAGVVVGYFQRPESVQAALAELHSLGILADAVHVIGDGVPIAVPETLPASRSGFQRLNAAVRRTLGRDLPAPAPVASIRSAAELVLVVQTTKLPAETIVAVLTRHGARQVDTRGELHSAYIAAADNPASAAATEPDSQL